MRWVNTVCSRPSLPKLTKAVYNAEAIYKEYAYTNHAMSRSSRQQIYIFLFSSENRIWYFMQIVS